MPKAPRKRNVGAKLAPGLKGKKKERGSKYFSTADDNASDVAKVEKKLAELFDGLLSDQDRTFDPDLNTMGADSMGEYMKQLGVNDENFEAFVLLDVVRAEGIGQLSRSGFVEGWKQVWLEQKVEPELSSQKRFIRRRIGQVPNDPALWKTLYQRAFLAGKEPEHKAVKAGIAIPLWDMLFDPAVYPWKTKNVDWLALWKEFLEAKWTRGVNKDMWSQTLVFANKTMEDDTLGFWSEDQAWPSVIDDFVLWCRETGAVPKKAGDDMNID